MHRIRKGKACAEDHSDDSIGSFRSIPKEKMQRPLIRPLCIQPSDPDHKPRPLCIQSPDAETKPLPAVSIPPPPAKHLERERFFKEKKMDGSVLTGHMRGLSLNSCNGSSSCSGSTDFSE